MKAERRHELQTNVLADWLNKQIELVKPHAGAILLGGALAIAAIVAVFYLASRTSGASSSAWADYYQATAVEDADSRISELSGVAERHSGTMPGAWAELMAGENLLLRGATARFNSLGDAESDLDKAQTSFETVLKDAERLPASQTNLLKQRALWGLAETFDAQAMGDDAVEQYELLATTYPDSAFGKAAAARAANLKGMGDWFTWYASVDPSTIKPTATQQRPPPGSGHGGSAPSGFNPNFPPRPPENELPDDPDFSLPDPLAAPGVGDLDFGIDPTEDLPPAGTDEPGADEPATDEPPVDAPATEEPAGDEGTPDVPEETSDAGDDEAPPAEE